MHRVSHPDPGIDVPQIGTGAAEVASERVTVVVESHLFIYKEEMQKVRKIFVSSAHRVSGTPSSFTTQLPVDVECGTPEQQCHIAITGVSLGHSWYGVQDLNNKLYFRENGNANAGTDHIVVIEPANYTSAALANKISQKMNNVATAGASYAVNFSSSTSTITVVQNNGSGFRVYTDQELRTTGPVDGLPIAVPQSINGILNPPPFVAYAATWTSGIVSIARVMDVFIRSSTLARGYSTIDPQGRRNVLKKIPVTVDFGHVIHTDNSYEVADLHALTGTIRSFDVSLTDLNGSELNLGNLDWSFAISLVYGPLE